MADEHVSTAAPGKEKPFDASKLTINDIDWYHLHSLAITHGRDKGKMLGALEAEIDRCLDNISYQQQRERAFLLVKTHKYLELYGHWAMEEALQQCIQKGTYL